MNLLVTNPANIRYLTGFVGVAPEEREAYTFLTETKTYLFTNSLYLEQAKKLPKIELIEISRENPISKELARLCDELKITKLGFEETNLTVAELKKLESTLTGVKLIPTQNRIEDLRQIKRPDEITNIKKACEITDSCFRFIIKKLKPGVTEPEITWEIESFFRKNNADSAFSPIVAFGKNSSQPHYSPGVSFKRRGLTKLDLVLIDMGSKYNGYCADMTRVVFFGPPKPEWKRAYDAVAAAQQKVFALLRDGERNGAVLDRAAKDVIDKAGFPSYQHGLGHGIGMDIHEAPKLSIKKNEKLLPGMVFSVEPGTYIEGQYGIRIEDLVLLKKDGVEILT